MRFSENVEDHYHFETTRGIYHHYTIDSLFDRVQEELDEARVELSAGDLAKLFREVMDVWNIIGSLILHIISELGITPEQVDTVMEMINKSRDAKYAVEYFEALPPEEAIRVSRDTWEMRRNGHY